MHNILFQVSLSNGETFYEGKGDYKDIPNLPSPWQRLNSYILDKSLSITSLSLYTRDGRTFNLPSMGKNPNFQAFRENPQPIDYLVKRCVGSEIQGSKRKVVDKFTVAVAIYPDYKLELWVDEINTRNSWVVVTE